MTYAFINNTKAEFLKCRRTAAFWITVGGAAFIPLINIIKCLARPDYFVSHMQADPWAAWFESNWQVAAAFFITMYIILVTSLVVQIEYKNNAWKQVYASPRSFGDIFFTKLTTILVIIGFCFVLFNGFILISAYITELFERDYKFSAHDIPFRLMFSTSVRLYISILAMISIQYWMSLRFKNFIAPMGAGLGLMTMGFMIRQWEHIDFYPYMYPLLVYFPNPGLDNVGLAHRVMLMSVGWFLLVNLFGFLNIALRTEKG